MREKVKVRRLVLSEMDLALGRAARYLVTKVVIEAVGPSHVDETRDVAVKLMSCALTGIETNDDGWVSAGLLCPRDLYEMLWPKRGFYFELRGGWTIPSYYIALALYRAANGRGDKVAIFPQYGAPVRTPEEQTELYQYVFGDDPVGQQVQVLDVGKHSAPTRQLIVSPVPVLPVHDLKRDESLCFVAMPFAAPLRPVYDNAITRAATEAGLSPRRGDDINQPGAILTQVWHAILSARLVIADVSGANGNVLYELGLAHVVGHEAILLTQNIENVPFDLRHQRVIVYENTPEGLDALRTQLTAAIQTALASSKR